MILRLEMYLRNVFIQKKGCQLHFINGNFPVVTLLTKPILNRIDELRMPVFKGKGLGKHQQQPQLPLIKVLSTSTQELIQ